MVQKVSGKVQEGPRSPPNPLTNYLVSRKSLFVEQHFELSIVLPIVLPIGLPIVLPIVLPIGFVFDYTNRIVFERHFKRFWDPANISSRRGLAE